MWEWRHNEGNVAASENFIAFSEQDGLKGHKYLYIGSFAHTGQDIVLLQQLSLQDRPSTAIKLTSSERQGQIWQMKLRERMLAEYVQQESANLPEI